MTTSLEIPSPDWPSCGQGVAPQDPDGCRGRRIAPYGRCLAHLNDADRAAYLAVLAPGADLDHRGTAFAPDLLEELLDALRVSDTGCSYIGDARFDEATFSAAIVFAGATFSGEVSFANATFSGDARFDKATFSDFASFDEATFSAEASFAIATFSAKSSFGEARFSTGARFDKTTFSDVVSFDEAMFSAEVSFAGATFSDTVSFDDAMFSAYVSFAGAMFSAYVSFARAAFFADVWFGEARFSAFARFVGATFFDNVWFAGATFEAASELGPFACMGILGLSGALFSGPTTIAAAASQLECRLTRWTSTASMRLRYAYVDLTDAVLSAPLTLSAHQSDFEIPRWPPGERAQRYDSLVGSLRARSTPEVRLTSVNGVDTAHLVLTDIDLSQCRFAGALHLDQVRLEGRCTFASTPAGLRWHCQLPVRWSPRRTLAEECQWRYASGARGWTAPEGPGPVPGPAVLGPVYRQLRKSFEDGKNTPDAADFYYGEMEMRRHDRERPQAERLLIRLYWAGSGYGLRASRALGWLLLAMVITVISLTLWGIPAAPASARSAAHLATGTTAPLAAPSPVVVGPSESLSERLTGKRGEKSLQVTLNSVIFRSAGQDLTTAGTYIEMASRLAEPVLLGLAVLAVRGRVKR
jgi:hypothetical protein